MTMGASALDLEGLAQVGDDGASLQEAAQAFDDLRGPLAEVSQSALAHLAGLPVGLAQENGRGRVAVGNGFDVHGHYNITYYRQ